jgi:hypothetical protein
MSCLFGVDAKHAYFQHTVNLDPIVLDDVDTVVTGSPNRRVEFLAAELSHTGQEIHLIGDCLSPRTAEKPSSMDCGLELPFSDWMNRYQPD